MQQKPAAPRDAERGSSRWCAFIRVRNAVVGRASAGFMRALLGFVMFATSIASAGACADIAGLPGYSTACGPECVDDASTGTDTDSAAAIDDTGVDDMGVDGEDRPESLDAPGACDATDCSDGPSSTSWACPRGGCDEPGGRCSVSSTCYCTSDSQCIGARCVKVAGQNDVSCAAGCTGTGAADGFGCELSSPGIPASCSVVFGYTPTNLVPGAYAAPVNSTTIDCATTYDTTTHAFSNWCAGRTKPGVTPGIAQAGGPNMDVLAFAGLTIASGGSLTLTGANAIVLAVYGDASIAGGIHADGADGTSGGNAPGPSGPGGNYSCGAGTGASQPTDGHCSGGGGGGAGAAGGAGAGGVGGTIAAGGAARANAPLHPLYGGCPGGTSGNWACVTAGGGGGGALQISAAGTLAVSGTISTNGGAGGTSSCFAVGCGANGYGGGGGGAGSGGAILLEGQQVVTTGATITANGGAGGAPNTAGGGGTGIGGQGGASGTASFPVGGAGTGATSNACGSYTQCGGGGGGSYGYVRVNQQGSAPSYSCVTTLSPKPVCASGHGECLCVDDTDCASGRCVQAGQCSGTCTGAGSADQTDCQIVTAEPAE
jgi:hypothetical protein